MKKLTSRLTAATAILAGGLLVAAHAAGAPKTNVVFVLADDLGWAELGCYGNTFNETPPPFTPGRQAPAPGPS